MGKDPERASGRPWDTGKNVEASSPLGPLHPAEIIGHPSHGAIALSVNGTVRQSADLADLIWPVVPGDEMLATIEGLEPLRMRVGEPAR